MSCHHLQAWAGAYRGGRLPAYSLLTVEWTRGLFVGNALYTMWLYCYINPLTYLLTYGTVAVVFRFWDRGKLPNRLSTFVAFNLRRRLRVKSCHFTSAKKTQQSTTRYRSDLSNAVCLLSILSADTLISSPAQFSLYMNPSYFRAYLCLL